MVAKALGWFRWLFGVFPKSAVGSPVVFHVFHYTMLFLVFVLFSYFSPAILEMLGLPNMGVERLPIWLKDFVMRIWCGLVFLLFYAIVRVTLVLVAVLGIEEDSEFPDIDDAWAEIEETLEDANIDPMEFPIFVVNGLTARQEDAFFGDVSGLDWSVVAPRKENRKAPIRVFVETDALKSIVISVTGLSATNLQQSKFASGNEPSGDRGGRSVPTGNVFMTAIGAAFGKRPANPISTNADVARPAIPEEFGTQNDMGGGAGTAHDMQPPPAAPAAPPRPAPSGTLRGTLGGMFGSMMPGAMGRGLDHIENLKSHAPVMGNQALAPLDDDEMSLTHCRFGYLCTLINRMRSPVVPINGVIQAVPYSWTKKPTSRTAQDQDAAHIAYAESLAPAISQDLRTLRDVLGLVHPIVFCVTELDTIRGTKLFLEQLNRLHARRQSQGHHAPDPKLTRVGQRFGAGAQVERTASEALADGGYHWFRGCVYQLFLDDLSVEDNRQLFALLCEVSQRRSALSRLVSAVMSDVDEPHRVYGLYFAAVGTNKGNQAFVRGIVEKLVDAEEDIVWDEAVEHSASQSRTMAVLSIVASIVLIGLSLAIYLTQLRGESVS